MPSTLPRKSPYELNEAAETDIPVKRLAPALIGGMLMVLLVCWILPMRIARAFHEVDMTAYYVAALAVLHHTSPYRAPIPTYGPDRYPTWYLYDPQFAALVSPLGKLTFKNYGGIWLVIVLSSLIGYSYNLAALTRPNAMIRDRVLDFLTWFLVLCLTPGMLYSAAIGNIDIFVTFLTSLAFVSTRRRLLLFALAVQIKPFAAVPAVLSWWRERQNPSWAIICLMSGICLGAAVCGIGSFLDWGRSASILGEGTFHGSNASISFGLLRLLRWSGVWHYGHGPLPAGPHLYLLLMGAFGPLLTAYAARRMPDLEYYAVVLLSTVLFAPICWQNYIVIAYLIVALRLRRRFSPELDKRSGDQNNLPADAVVSP